MTSNFFTTAQDYLRKFQAEVELARRGKATSVEMATRPVADGFIKDLVRLCQAGPDHADVYHEGKVTNDKRPDWRIEDPKTFGVFAYGDQKNLNESAQFDFTDGERKQMEKYLKLGRPVFVFDGIEFIFLDPSERKPFDQAKRHSLVTKPLPETDWSALDINPLVETAFLELLKNPGFKQWSESDLIEQLATRAGRLADDLVDLLNAPKDSGTDLAESELIKALHDLRQQLASHHDPTLTGAESCSKFVAQVLIFGMFYAHTKALPRGSTIEERHQVIRTFWTDETFLDVAAQLRPFHLIAKALEGTLSVENNLSIWYRDAALVLAHAEYYGTISGPTDFHILFEKFFASFSPSDRFDYGAWYTPPALTDWMVRFADNLSRRSFNLGLAESTSKVIDPCVGTGGFLEAFVNFVGTDECDTDLIGFEILPAPYALAHYRLSEVLSTTTFETKLHLFLTDTLADQIEKPPEHVTGAFDKEITEASQLAKPPLCLVLGNPPSSINASSGARRDLIEDKLERFRPPKHARSGRQNIQKALNNEAYRFLLWCSNRVISADRGILALVVPGSFVHSVSLRYAREWMKANFDQLWILELDEDARTGARTDSLFKVLQGRAVIFALTGAEESPVRHHSIVSMDLAEKTAFLEAGVNLETFQIVNGKPDQLAPNPVEDNPDFERKPDWVASWPLIRTTDHEGIFKEKCSGAKLAPTSALFHVDEQRLKRRSNELATTKKPFDEIFESWFKGQQRPPKESKFPQSVRTALGNAVDEKNNSILSYTYRPFVKGYAVVDDELFRALKEAPGDGARARPEVRAAFKEGAAAILVATKPRDLGDQLTRFVSFAWDLPDNDNAARGDSMVYCDLYPGRYPGSPAERLKWKPEARANTSVSVQTLFNAHAEPNRAIIYYCYAVMSCNSYLDAFEPFLFFSADPQNPFRVPIAKDEDLRDQLVEFGKRLAACENFHIALPDEDFDIAIDDIAINWPEDCEEFRLKSAKIIEQEGKVELYGYSGELAVLEGLSNPACTHRIAGHDVLKKWLRERTFSYLRRTFRRPDLDELIDVILRLETQLLLLDEIDELVHLLLNEPDQLEPPPSAN